MPLADLHRHLDGSLRPATLAELAGARGLEVPDDLCFTPGMGLADALARFRFTLSVLDRTDAVARVAGEMCEDASADGVEILEIRFAPQLHGSSPADVVDAALDGVAGRAGLILCGLYGEPPSVLSSLVDLARTRPGVVGIDLAGGPAPDHEFALTDYQEPFFEAREIGLGRTVHAGEGRPPAEIADAVELLGAQRIGHGTTLLDDAEVTELVVARGVVIEACPTSNVHTGALSSVGDHPLVRWLDRGVRVCVCSDNTLLSNVTLSEELDNLRAIAGFTADHRAAICATAAAAAFPRR